MNVRHWQDYHIFWVDNAYSCDPRIKKFKEEEKAKKEAEKKAKAEARRKEQEAKEKQKQAELEAVRLAKEKEEKEVRQQALLAKKEKDIQKKAIKKERQKLRNSCKVCQTAGVAARMSARLEAWKCFTTHKHMHVLSWNAYLEVCSVFIWFFFSFEAECLFYYILSLCVYVDTHKQ